MNDLNFSALHEIANAAYQDAKTHGLYDDVDLCLGKRSVPFVRQRLCLLIREEVCEAYEAYQDPKHYAEELADIMIMCMSAAEHLGIDIANQVERKMEINRKRPFMHGKRAQNGS